jgi:hypothetical protein
MLSFRLLKSLLFIALFFNSPSSVNAVYGRVPGERYLGFLRVLSEGQKAIVRGLIFEPSSTRDQARADVENWAHNESPLTMVCFFVLES